MQSRDSQGLLLPLTVKQISEAFQASDDKANFLIDGVDVNNVGYILFWRKNIGWYCELNSLLWYELFHTFRWNWWGCYLRRLKGWLKFLLHLMMELVESIPADGIFLFYFSFRIYNGCNSHAWWEWYLAKISDVSIVIYLCLCAHFRINEALDTKEVELLS